MCVKTSRGTESWGRARLLPSGPHVTKKACNCTIIHEQLEKSPGVWITTSTSWVCYFSKFHLAITCLLMCSTAYGLALLSDSWGWSPAIHGSLALDCLCGFFCCVFFFFNGGDRKQASLCVWLSMHSVDGRGSGCVVLYNMLSVYHQGSFCLLLSSLSLIHFGNYGDMKQRVEDIEECHAYFFFSLFGTLFKNDLFKVRRKSSRGSLI